MSSCGNPNTEADALMTSKISLALRIIIIDHILERPKYDRHKACVKCKLKSGNIVIRHAVYCKYARSTLFRTNVDRTFQRMLLSFDLSTLPTHA